MDYMPIILLFLAPFRNNATLVLAALTFTLLDFLIGFVGAVIRKEVSSKVLRQGIGHKLASVAFIATAGLLDAVIGTGKLVGCEPVMAVACIYLIIMELISVLENIRKANPDLAGNPLETVAESAAKHLHHD